MLQDPNANIGQIAGFSEKDLQRLALMYQNVSNFETNAVHVTVASNCPSAITHQTIQNVWLYVAVVFLVMGANNTRNMKS
jgi:hypothetical protein